MEDKSVNPAEAGPVKTRSGFWLVVKVFALVALIAVIGILFWVKHNFYASRFTPTELSSQEQTVLDAKLAMLGRSAEKEEQAVRRGTDNSRAVREPEAYSEDGADREIRLTEKELNALIADNPELAERVALDLSKSLVSLKLVLPLDDELPVIGGKTLRLNAGLKMGYEDGQLFVALKGVSIGGIPLPNAWLGNIKERNIVEEFGSEDGFWKLFSEGIQDITVQDGQIAIQLNE